MGTLEPLRYEDGKPMLFAGIRRTYTFADMATGIPHQWQDFLALDSLPGRVGHTSYGAICGGDVKARTMEYMCAAEVASFDPLPQHLGRMRVPAVRYAVFLHAGNVATIRDTWRQIFGEWLPSSGLQSAETPDFEVYRQGFDGATGEGGVEIWLGVKPAS
jgi:predicted transcriptional regulator YdeE